MGPWLYRASPGHRERSRAPAPFPAIDRSCETGARLRPLGSALRGPAALEAQRAVCQPLDREHSVVGLVVVGAAQAREVSQAVVAPSENSRRWWMCSHSMAHPDVEFRLEWRKQ